ncbi:hypothetical protein AAFF_G00428140 [Aldrovandia affinis]|uniref:Uncharacterized protein n=1 Tax=Aldrovandia affinis TaxID=143900 RepID=A0AAD7S946_9TELE|nr:hypothetical protein AAFF_G00428140 [Aldrovandia affinis]
MYVLLTGGKLCLILPEYLSESRAAGEDGEGRRPNMATRRPGLLPSVAPVSASCCSPNWIMDRALLSTRGGVGSLSEQPVRARVHRVLQKRTEVATPPDEAYRQGQRRLSFTREEEEEEEEVEEALALAEARSSHRDNNHGNGRDQPGHSSDDRECFRLKEANFLFDLRVGANGRVENPPRRRLKASPFGPSCCSHGIRVLMLRQPVSQTHGVEHTESSGSRGNRRPGSSPDFRRRTHEAKKRITNDRRVEERSGGIGSDERRR